MDEHADSWTNQELDHNSASPNNVEIWDVDGNLVSVASNAPVSIGSELSEHYSAVRGIFSAGRVRNCVSNG